MSGDWTTGRLLVATPEIGEGVFFRSVVLILQHDENGAQGVVLNRPLDADVNAVLPGWGEHVSDPPTVFQGGPVQLDSALGLVSVPGYAAVPQGVQRLFDVVGVVDLDTSPLLIAPELEGMRIFAGYSGWSPGQLEGELARGSWFILDSRAGDVFTDAPDSLWRQVLRRQPGSLAFVACFPDDPSHN